MNKGRIVYLKKSFRNTKILFQLLDLWMKCEATHVLVLIFLAQNIVHL
jgi:hypothetical protein